MCRRFIFFSLGSNGRIRRRKPKSSSCAKRAVVGPNAADYLIWGTVNQAAPHEFAATVSAVSSDGGECLFVEVALAESLDAARLEMERLMVEAGAKVCALGHRVVDVE